MYYKRTLYYHRAQQVPRLVVKYQNSDNHITVAELAPSIRLLVSSIRYLLKRQGEIFLKKWLIFLTATISHKLDSSEFNQSMFRVIENANKLGESDFGKNVVQSLSAIRSLFEKDKTFFTENFQDILPQENQQDFLDRYMEIVSKITREHVQEVIQNIKNEIARLQDNHENKTENSNLSFHSL